MENPVVKDLVSEKPNDSEEEEEEEGDDEDISKYKLDSDDEVSYWRSRSIIAINLFHVSFLSKMSTNMEKVI